MHYKYCVHTVCMLPKNPSTGIYSWYIQGWLNQNTTLGPYLVIAASVIILVKICARGCGLYNVLDTVDVWYSLIVF